VLDRSLDRESRAAAHVRVDQPVRGRRRRQEAGRPYAQ